MYLKKRYKAGQTIEIQKTFSKRYGKKIARGGNVNKTPDAVANYNKKMAVREIGRKINANFGPDDVHMVLRHRKGQDVTPPQAKAMLDKAIRQLRAELRKLNREIKKKYPGWEEKELKYLRATAVGERGGIHHHLVINVTEMALLRKAWPYGSINLTPLYSNGEYSGLAKYFVGQGKGEPGGAIYIEGNLWSGSRNLRKVKSTVERVSAKVWREPPTPEKGYLIDVDSIDPGVNPVTGMPYLFYRMVKINQSGPAAEAARQANRKAVLHEWAKRYDSRRIQKFDGQPKRPKGKGPPQAVTGH